MNKLTTPIFIAVSILVSFTQSFSLSAQSTASTNIAATIVTPTTISKENDLEFPNASIGFKSSDNKTAHRIGKANQNNKIEVLEAGKVVNGLFAISGAPGYMYNLTIPKNVNLTINNQLLHIDIRACAASGNQTISQNGLAVVSIEGVLSTGHSDGLAYNSGKYYDFPITMNTE